MREERNWILTFSEAFQACQAPRLDYRVGRAFRRSDWSYLPSRSPKLPLQISINSIKQKGGARKMTTWCRIERQFVRSGCGADHWISFISHVRATPQSPHIYTHLYVSISKAARQIIPQCVCTVCALSSCAPFDERLAASLRLRAPATTAVQAAGFVFSTSHPDVGAHLGSRLLQEEKQLGPIN